MSSGIISPPLATMGTVQDPNFWKRFSTAVHQHDAEQAAKQGIKHTYVTTICTTDSNNLSPIATPTSQSHLSPTFATPLSQSLSRPDPSPATIDPPIPLEPSSPLRLTKPPPTHPPHTHQPRKSRSRSITQAFTRHTNSSHLTLGLSGRPPSRFKFWTSVSADPSNRDSWLEAQQKKRRQRAWICWFSWLGLGAVVAGVVVTIFVLREKHVI